MNLRAAAQQALEWAESHGEAMFAGGGLQAVEHMNAWTQALRAALAQANAGNPITDYWFEHYVKRGLCSLCGNYGVIDTRGTRTPAGVAVGALHFCICPNGQKRREAGRALAQEPEPVQEPACSCSLRGRLVGDGCEVCNPELAAELRQQPEPVQEPVAWLRVIDEAMVTYHLGVAEPTDDYETAKRKMNNLLCHAEDIGAYFATPPQRPPLTDEEILAAVGWERSEMYMKLVSNFPVDEAKQETLKNARAVERKVRGVW